jgi:hypothetical protein
MKKNHAGITLILILGAFVLGACGSSDGKATPTSTPWSVEAISTAAAQTVIAQLTLEAPTITPTPVFTNTPDVTATPTQLVPTATRPSPTAVNCANSIFVSDVSITDGTQMPAGMAFTKTWRVQNTGTCPWTTNFKLVFVSGDSMGAQTVNLASTVATGQKVDISVNMIVPNKSGKVEGIWGLMDDKGQRFGELVAVRITIGALSPTPTDSDTETPTQAITPASTATETSVSTETPTETATTTP